MAHGTPLPAIYIPHGGGPCFFMEWTMGPPDTWESMRRFLADLLSRELPAPPRAIVVVSAHWEADPVRVNFADDPGLLFDYYGFPPHTYELTWPARGAPALAQRVEQLLGEAGIDSERESQRGYDHGVFVPLKVALPEPRIPVVQLSLRSGLDPRFHGQLGEALAPLRREQVLLLGSGMSYHNMGAFQGLTGAALDGAPFDAWLCETCELPGPQRQARLSAWAQAPGARVSHPREEHLLPLMVVAGAGGQGAGKVIYRDRVMNAPVAAFRFD